MSQIELYIIDDKGRYLHKRKGSQDSVMLSVRNSSERYTSTPPPDNKSSWRWNGSEWAKVQLSGDELRAKQSEVWSDIKDARLKHITSGVYVASVGKVFHTDDISVIQYNNIGNMIALGNYEPIEWKVMDNTWLTLTESLFKELQVAMVAKTNKAYQVAEQHKANMLEMDNPEDYDYTTGWEAVDADNQSS